ncbi:hypothetical protein FR483_n290L [Paramecium bursaria Chlorella virus FR483]|uniref:Uncharacterized protein n290L n=1 Tax=Paramecium bursaria Chlorella virus FR483 TaxID=399781 RepID=A7J6Z4_PBCVF|nr:hypothetical protein FR483_n290L [Paramecium bursaria Chlorella virus FR483]ABT15575.1 hypothetical protein FR483_n290L [Paramecium bursaria Chlorella virus FR483]
MKLRMVYELLRKLLCEILEQNLTRRQRSEVLLGHFLVHNLHLLHGILHIKRRKTFVHYPRPLVDLGTHLKFLKKLHSALVFWNCDACSTFHSCPVKVMLSRPTEHIFILLKYQACFLLLCQ